MTLLCQWRPLAYKHTLWTHGTVKASDCVKSSPGQVASLRRDLSWWRHLPIVIQVTIQLTTYSFPLYYLPQGGYVSLAVSDCWFLVGLSTGQQNNTKMIWTLNDLNSGWFSRNLAGGWSRPRIDSIISCCRFGLRNRSMFFPLSFINSVR